jgi:hypothetical protein
VWYFFEPGSTAYSTSKTSPEKSGTAIVGRFFSFNDRSYNPRLKDRNASVTCL